VQLCHTNPLALTEIEGEDGANMFTELGSVAICRICCGATVVSKETYYGQNRSKGTRGRLPNVLECQQKRKGPQQASVLRVICTSLD